MRSILVIAAFALATFSVPSFGKVFDCWARFDGNPDWSHLPAMKFTLDSSERIENGVVMIDKETASGRRMTARFVISSYSEVATMALILGDADKFETDFTMTSSEMELKIGKESHLNTVGYVKGGFGYDYVAKMGCTYVRK